MSGIVAGAQAAGCCCRPVVGCQCTNPTRPGAIIDASLTAINIQAELDVRESVLENGRVYLGCGECPCDYSVFGGTIGPIWGRDPNGPYYPYVPSGCIVDPAFTEDTECESIVCTPGGCACCPEYSISAGFGNQVLEQQSSRRWDTVSRSVDDHMVGAWNWRPQQVGYCNAVSGWLPNARVRRFCRFFLVPFSPSGNISIDPNGQYLDQYGNYTGANIGICAAYATAAVLAPTPTRCAYEARIGISYQFQSIRRDDIMQAGGMLVDDGGTYIYRKPCLSPQDSVLGTYECIYCEPTFSRSTDQECGSIRSFYEIDITPPQTITIS